MARRAFSVKLTRPVNFRVARHSEGASYQRPRADFVSGTHSLPISPHTAEIAYATSAAGNLEYDFARRVPGGSVLEGLTCAGERIHFGDDRLELSFIYERGDLIQLPAISIDNEKDCTGAVLLDTPYGFQENASEITERAVEYFAHRVQLTIEAAGFLGPLAVDQSQRTKAWGLDSPKDEAGRDGRTDDRHERHGAFPTQGGDDRFVFRLVNFENFMQVGHGEHFRHHRGDLADCYIAAGGPCRRHQTHDGPQAAAVDESHLAHVQDDRAAVSQQPVDMRAQRLALGTGNNPSGAADDGNASDLASVE